MITIIILQYYIIGYVVCAVIHGVHVFFKDQDTPLMIASKEKHWECVNLLLERGAQVNVKDKLVGIRIMFTLY